MIFRRNRVNNAAHCDHAHNEIDEALELTESRHGRKKLLVAGIANAAIMGAAGVTAYKSGAGSTWIETVHDLGDTGYYLVPWFATIKSHLHSVKAIKWMRGTAYTAAGLAATSMTLTLTDAVINGAEHPEAFSAPAQLGFALGNVAIALYVGKEEGSSTIDHAALRHAKNDARTSVVAGISNAAALAIAPLNPIGAVLVGAMTIETERRTIKETNQALEHTHDEA